MGGAQHHSFTKAVARALRQRCGVTGGDRLIVATSGGCDSVALLRALAALAPRRTWRLTLAVGHVQHHLRAARYAEADARFVAGLAERLEVPFMRGDLKPPRGRTNREDWARRARYAALAEMAGAFNAGAIVTAHHQDDQLETLLMRMLRGASVRGLAGMAWRRRLTALEAGGAGGKPAANAPPPLLLRPMLAVDRGAAQRFLTDIGQGWREDHTNRDTTRLRAALRHEVLPALRLVCPQAAGRGVGLTDHFRQIARLLDRQVALAADHVAVVDGKSVINRGDARLLESVVLGGLLRRLLIQRGVGRDRLGGRTLKPIMRAVRDTRGGTRMFNLGGGVRVSITREAVTIGRK